MQPIKVTNIGNSAGIVIPRSFLRKLRVAPGDYLFLTESPDGYRLTPYDPFLERHLSAAREFLKVERSLLREIEP